MGSILKKLLLVGFLCIAGALFAAEDYYAALERVENWLGKRYDKSSLVYRERRRKLERIVNAEDSDAAKIAALKKEFPEAFASDPSGVAAVRSSDDRIVLALPGDVKLALAKVDAGSFEMSARDGENFYSEVPHRATLTKDFYIGQTEVTQAQWRAVMGDNPSKFKGDDLPVEQVSWYDAMAFCEKLNSMGKAPAGYKFTLPTETQWEFAARGGKKSRGCKYSGSNDVGEVAWYYDNSGYKTHPVASKKANELGLYDMSGNVREWCLDDWDGDSSKAEPEFARSADDSNGSRRVSRDGSWLNEARFCRSAGRGDLGPGSRYDVLGFRVALVPVR